MKNLIKNLLLALFIIAFGANVFASDSEDALKFFNSFVSASNSYSPSLLNFYSEDARIIRQVIKPNGSTANAYFTMIQYKSQLKLSSKMAKLRNYKNRYSNIRVSKVPEGYRIDSLRQPSGEDYKLKAHMILKKTGSGKFVIIEELMQTKEQIFLKYAKSK